MKKYFLVLVLYVPFIFSSSSVAARRTLSVPQLNPRSASMSLQMRTISVSSSVTFGSSMSYCSLAKALSVLLKCSATASQSQMQESIRFIVAIMLFRLLPLIFS